MDNNDTLSDILAINTVPPPKVVYCLVYIT